MKAEGHDRINVANNPINFIDPWGLERIVLLTGGPRVSLPSKSDPASHYNVFGHTALAIDDTVYSFGTNYAGGGLNGRDWGASVKDYLDAQRNIRTTHEIVLSLSPEQTKKLMDYLKNNVPDISKYSAGEYDCSTVTADALKNIDYLKYNDSFTPPATLYNHVQLKESINRAK